MEKYGTAADCQVFCDVDVHNQGDIVEVVLPGKFFMACRIGQTDRTIIIAVAGRIAPTIVGGYANQLDMGLSNGYPFRANHRAEHRKLPPWGDAITLTTLSANARSTKCTVENAISGPQQALGSMAGAGRDI